MTARNASTLDTDKLRKVRALMTGGATAGERAAATVRGEALARRAGMTLQAALSKLDAAPAQPAAGNVFAGFDDWVEAREPGWKARRATERAERERRRLARCRDLLVEFGSEEAVFAATPLEEALRHALAPLRDPQNSLWGYRGYKAGTPTPEMWEAMAGVVPVPETVEEAWEAYLAQEARTDARIAFCPDHAPQPWEDAWRSALEYLLDTLPGPTAAGIAARIAWLRFLANREFSRDAERDQMLAATLQADSATFSAAVPSGHRNAGDKAAAVQAVLRDQPDLSDREMARRVGVSPQTVGNWRRRMAGGVA